MALDAFQSEVLRLLAEHEQLISQMYKSFAVSFPEYRDFWNEISLEETEHAEILRSLRQSIQDADAHFNKNTFPLEAVRFSIASVRKVMDEVKSGQVTPIAALSLARDYENSLIEKDFLKVVEADSDAVKEALGRLSMDTGRHRDRIDKLLAEARSRGR